jgi:hypothetical protein
LSTSSRDRLPSSTLTLRSLLGTTAYGLPEKGDGEPNRIEAKKRRVRVQSNSLRGVLDLVAERGEGGGNPRSPSLSATMAVSAETMREEVIRRSELQAAQLLSDKAAQERIDQLSLLTFLSTAADLLRLLCRFQKKTIFPLVEVTKHLSSSLRLAGGSFASSSLLPQRNAGSSSETESLVISMLSEVVPEYVSILPGDAAAGVNYVTVRVNLNTPMGPVRDKLRQIGDESSAEKMKLVRPVARADNK